MQDLWGPFHAVRVSEIPWHWGTKAGTSNMECRVCVAGWERQVPMYLRCLVAVRIFNLHRHWRASGDGRLHRMRDLALVTFPSRIRAYPNTLGFG